MNRNAYVGGVIVGAGLALILLGVLILMLKRKAPKPKYDEMQLAARGKAFRAGFFGMMIANGGGILVSLCGFRWLTAPFILAAALMAGAGVFCVSAVKNDAYFGFNENKKSGTIFIGLMGCCNLLIGLARTLADGLLDGDELNVAVLNLMVAVLSAVILIAILVHGGKAAEEEE